jgi:hypothetical protein
MQSIATHADAGLPLAGWAAFRELMSLRFSLQIRGSAERESVESYIRARFAARHSARIVHFLPNLIALGNGERYCGAVGLAAASSGPLFAETYLDAPVEQVIAQATGEAVSRADILEIGNLVSTWKGSSLLLFVFLTEVIGRLGHRWVLFTATREVESLLARLKYCPVAIADANPARLPDGGASWGRYYRQMPRVMFGDVPPALAAARKGVLYRAAARAISGQVDRVCAEFRLRNPAGR